MVDIEDIPAEARWNIAARAANDMIFGYRRAFKEATKGAYEDELNEAIAALWGQAGKQQTVVADAFDLPRGTAPEVAETFVAISKLFLGPELAGGGVEPGEGDGAVIITTACPMASRAQQIGLDGRVVCNACRAYTTAAIESLNPDYDVRTARGICMGGDMCEMRIKRRQ
ncbi:MAG TPA: hypothetical protein ENN85_01725 [Methanoculleus sp.]|nr:hypothetical protein [Methanoculleus sp.]